MDCLPGNNKRASRVSLSIMLYLNPFLRFNDLWSPLHSIVSLVSYLIVEKIFKWWICALFVQPKSIRGRITCWNTKENARLEGTDFGWESSRSHQEIVRFFVFLLCSGLPRAISFPWMSPRTREESLCISLKKRFRVWLWQPRPSAAFKLLGQGPGLRARMRSNSSLSPLEWNRRSLTRPRRGWDFSIWLGFFLIASLPCLRHPI